MLQTILLLSFVIIFSCSFSVSAFSCSPPCSCNSTESEELIIRCNFCPSFCTQSNEHNKLYGIPFTIETLKAFLAPIPQNISYLSLSCIDLKSIPGGYFKGIKLTKFRCYRCNLMDISSNAFSGLEHDLKEIDLERNKLTEIKDQFKRMRVLKSINLKFNSISSLAITAFSNSENTLESVDFRGNQLTSYDAFKNLKALKILNLCSNMLKFSPNALELPNSLESLEICGANFPKITKETLKGFTNLKSLKIIDSLLSYIEPGSFDYLNATSIVLGYNNLSFIDGIFHDNLELNELYLYNNKLTHLTEKSFSGLTQLNTLSILYNRIEKIEVTAFKDLTHLISLSLTGNNIKEIQKNTFLNTSSLTALNLDNNNILDLDPGVFNGLNNLENLRLKGNNLTEVKKGTFTMASLKELDLSNNKIAKVENGAFGELVNLTSLYLYNNNFTNLDVDNFGNKSSKTEYYIEMPPIIDPPFMCYEEE